MCMPPDDLPLSAFRLHTWVHCFGMCNWDKIAALHVRVTIKEPRKDGTRTVSGETRSVSAQARKLETENALAAKAVLRQNYVWEQHVALDFSGHEDTEIMYELWSARDDGQGLTIVGACRFACVALACVCLCAAVPSMHLKGTAKAQRGSGKQGQAGCAIRGGVKELPALCAACFTQHWVLLNFSQV